MKMMKIEIRNPKSATTRSHSRGGSEAFGFVRRELFGRPSLTLTLFRWEKENRSPTSVKSGVDDCSMVSGESKKMQLLFPLPAGEGQGEGERSANLTRKSTNTRNGFTLLE